MSSLDNILAGDDSGLVVLAETSAEAFQGCTSELVGKVTEKGYKTIIITINNPSPILRKTYLKSGIDISNLYFIDAITRYALGSIPKDDDGNTSYISQPSNLTDMGIELNKLLVRFDGAKVCVIIDSVNTMLIYVSSGTMTKFIHFVSNKLRLLNCLGIFLSINGSVDPMLLNQLKSFSDEFVEI
ncbi:MAG: hypothetical protein JW931_03935 [Methanomicrobiaceae archaeon]|nr:hypothetical protein [Methanomicrobiaceae archaeon]